MPSQQESGPRERSIGGPSRRSVVAALGGGALLGLAGCLGQSPGGGETNPLTDTATTTEPTTSHEPIDASTVPRAAPVDFPDGPKGRPSIPPTLDESTLRAFVETFERRLVYNRLYIDDHGSVQVMCTSHSATDDGTSWRVVVSCEGAANHPERTGADGSITETAVTRDRFLRYYTYVVTATTVGRREATAAERP